MKEEARTILLLGFRSFFDATKDAPAEGEKAIFKWILPACLEIDQVVAGSSLDTHRVRELLAAWIDQYADEHKVPLRARVPVWTASVIGLRTPQLEVDLGCLTQRNDNVGDAALECLATLFPDTEIRNLIVRKVLRRLATREAHDFFSAISSIRDARFIPILSRKLFAEEKRELFITSLLGRVADRAPLAGVYKITKASCHRRPRLPAAGWPHVCQK